MKDINEASSDEEAPTSVSFASGKKQRQEEFQKEISAAHNQKQRLKLKRHKQHEQLKRQKEEKNQRLEIDQLPEEFLHSLPLTPVNLPEDSIDIEKTSVKKFTSPEEKKSKILKKERRKMKKQEILEQMETEDFIPIEGCMTKFKIRVLEEEDKFSQKIAAKSSRFLKSRLYGRHVQRESSEKFMGKKKKQIIGGHR